jgi:glycosyltransferase involved in cell wall biosynthesis
MKGFFYFRMDLDAPEHIGVRKKILHILEAFRASGVETDAAFFTDRGLEMGGEVLMEFSANRLRRGWEKNSAAYRRLLARLDFRKYDFAWLRVGLVLPWASDFIKKMQRQNPQMKIFLEFGTYPFDAELEGPIKTLYPVSEFYLKRQKGRVSRIITFCGQDEIHDIACVKMRNGISVEEHPWRSAPPAFSDTLDLIAVSTLHNWHAYDRLIEGMKRYYEKDFARKKINVRFHIVGDGDKKSELRQMASEFGLEDKVIFYGFKSGAELDAVFEQSHVAVGTLGMHRIKAEVVSSLKNREYCARGVPFVLATDDPDFPATLNFVHYVPGDDSPLDITALIEFYENLAADRNFPKTMRDYALENLDWKSKIAPVLEMSRTGKE